MRYRKYNNEFNPTINMPTLPPGSLLTILSSKLLNLSPLFPDENPLFGIYLFNSYPLCSAALLNN